MHDFATVWYRPVVSTRSSSLQRVPCRQVLDECSWRDRSSIVHQRECKIIDLLCWNSTSKLPDCECAVLEQCPAGQYSGTNVLSCIRCSAGKYLTNAAGITEGASCSTVSFRELVLHPLFLQAYFRLQYDMRPACIPVWYRPVVSARSSSLQHLSCRQIPNECFWWDGGGIMHQSECSHA